MHRYTAPALTALALALLAPPASAGVAGAAYTTFDAILGGCLDSPNGVNCNHYESKDQVYTNGGPSRGGWSLADGDYFFAVIVPGTQNSGFVDGADGNLSDAWVGATAGDDGSGDDVSNRTFTVINHEVVYTGTHALGNSLADGTGRDLIGLAPFDDTDNPGGVYMLAICEVGATGPSQCKYDAFKVEGGDDPSILPVISGMKYYDADADGQYDAGEVGISGWQIEIMDHMHQILSTEADGTFTVSMSPDLYSVFEGDGGGTWMQTGNLVDQTGTTGGATATLLADMTYEILVDMDQTVDGLYFGNVCLGAGGGHTLGFWSNKNGAAIMKGADNYATSLALMRSLHLVNGAGATFDPTSYSAFRSWLLSATATNMAYMLSAQLAAMQLNVWSGGVNGGGLIYAPGAAGANANGFLTVNALIAEADAALAADGYTPSGDPNRAYQEALKDALDDGNNNLNFLQPGPASCPVPVF